MSQGKTEFRFTVNAQPQEINQVIQNYLAANQFAYQPKENANYYFYNDPLIKGKRALEYYMNGNQVLILAYLGTFEKPGALDGMVGALPKQSYRNDLAPLFDALQRLGNGTVYPNPAPGMQVQGVDAFVNDNNARKEKQVLIGFIMSIIGAVLAFFGFSYGIILLALEFYLGVQGLQTRRRGLAIATIVIACV